MERGPTALFGAIVAVGLGPALWLGVQLSADDAPVRKPPATVRQQVPAAAETEQGGSGAGEESDETFGPVADWIEPAPVITVVTGSSPSAAPSPSPSSPSASPSAQVSTTPSRSVEPSAPPVPPSTEPSVEPSQEPPTLPSSRTEPSSAPASAETPAS
ncbi:hypothetical protein [Actinoplanes sp. NPDC020271]|uniref:hypothetical protein n=1 Tax=Actinoplanes sp. NPDC020271 TaxID=3363896 RepID=UPI0037BBDA6B